MIDHEKTKEELPAEKGINLFNFVPFGYFTLTAIGDIAEINLAGAEMLGKERLSLIDSSFAHYITNDTRDIFTDFLSKTINGNSRESCEVALETDGGILLYAQLSGILADDGKHCKITLVDITERKQSELGLYMEVERTSLLLDLFAQAPVLSDKELYDRALDIAVNITNSKIGFLHLVSDNQLEINLTTWNEESMKECTSVYDNHYPLEKAGVWADSVRQKRPVIYNDYSIMSNKKGLPEGHPTIGRTMSIPVVNEGKVRLIFGVGNKSTDYNDVDVIQLQAIANELYKILEKRKVEKSLQKSEERWQFAIEGSNEGIWDWNVTTGEVFYSFRWKEMLGYGIDEVEGHISAWEERVHPEDIERVNHQLQNHFDHKTEDYVSEHRVLCKDGSWKWILDRGKVFDWTAEGKPARMLGTHTDISERKKAEEVQLEDQKTFRFLNELMSDYIFKLSVQPDGNFKMSVIAGNYAQATGRELEDASNPDDWYKVIYPADLPIINYNFKQVLELKRPVNFICRSYSADGSLRWIEVNASLDLDTQTQMPKTIFGSVRNITDRKLLEDAQAFLLSCGMPGTGEDFFNSLARYLSELLNMEYVSIERLESDGLTAQSIAIYNEGRFEYNVKYFLKDSPSSQAVERSFCSYRQGVRHLFPNDKMLRNMNAESFLSIALPDSKGKTIGIIKLIGYKPMQTEAKAEGLLRLVASRTAGELEIRDAENELKKTLEQLNKANFHMEEQVKERTQEILQLSNLQQAILRHAGLAIISTSADGVIEVFNDAAEEMLGYKAEEVVGICTPVIFHDPDELEIISRELTEESGEFVTSDFSVFQNILKRSFNQTREWRYVRKGGEKLSVNLTISSIKDDEGRLLGDIGIANDITQEKLSNLALRESEERFHSMFYDHSAVMLLVDPASGEIIEANNAAEEFYGYAFKNGPKLFITDLNTLSSEQVKDEMEKAIAHHRNYFIFPHKLASGEIRTVEVHSTPIDVKGTKVLFSIIHDITDRIEVETALKMQSSAFELFALSIIITDIKGRIQWANSAFTRLTGYSVEETIGKTPGELVNSGKQNKAFYKEFWDTILSKKVWTGELINRRKDGSLYVEEETITPVLDSQGNISSFISIKIDITERKQLYQELANEKRRLADIIKGTNAGTWEWNIQTGETIFNEQWAEILGYSLDEISPVSIQTWMNFAHPDDLKVSGELLEKHFNYELKYYSFESRMRHKNGRWVWVLDRGRVHEWDNEGKPLLMSGTHQDITDQKRAEEAMLKAKNEAEKANKAKSEFLSRMSHELRTPLNSILGFAQLLEMGELFPKQKKGVNHILNSGRHLLDLINEVLDISGIEAGRQILTPEPVQLAGIVVEVTDSIQIAANKRNVTIEVPDSPANKLFAQADRIRLKQVLINLLNNAIKYNKEGGKISIKTEQLAADSKGIKHVKISIIDTGIGINPEDIGKLFHAFERIGADKTETEGAGLGLLVAKTLTEAMDGVIGVESVHGTGSTFWIELPLIEKHKTKLAQNAAVPTPQLSVPSQVVTILYVEDNYANIELVEEIIADHRPSIKMLTANYGKQAIELLMEIKPGLILLDLDLPDMDGFEVLGILLADPLTKSIPVVIISADAMPNQLEKLMEAGASEYLTKPLDVVRFLKIIDKYTGNI